MTNFDAVDFSERRSEEVTSFFLRSVYIKMNNTQMDKITTKSRTVHTL